MTEFDENEFEKFTRGGKRLIDVAKWQHERTSKAYEDKVKALTLRIAEHEGRIDNLALGLRDSADTHDRLQAENERLNRIIAKELCENDELGSEFTYVNALRDEVARLNAVLELAHGSGESAK